MNEIYSHAPHRPAASADAHSSHAALLIDFDNVTMGIRSNLGQELRKLLDSDMIRGKVSVQRAYADWRRYPQYIASLSEASIDLIFAPAYGSTKKNATDIRLAIDALEIVFIRPEIGTFILLSGDSDFSSLVLKLKEYGKYVIGVGIQESSSDLLVQNCDEYYSYNTLSGLTSASEMQNIEKHDPWELAAKAISRMTERGDVMRSDRFKQVMLELDPSFSEKSIGFSKFNRFLTESASRGILDLHKAANGQYEVAIGQRVGDYTGAGAGSARSTTSTASTAGAPQVAARGSDAGRSRRRGRDDGSRTQKTEARSGRRGRSRGARDEAERPREAPPSVDEDRLRAAYELLRSVVDEKAGRGGSVRDSEVKRQMVAKDPDFDEAALGFRKFSRFLRQAHDEEVITLERTGEGNYKISAINGTGADVRKAPPVESTAQPSGDGRSRSRGRRDRRDRSSGREGKDAADEQASAPTEEDSPPPVSDVEPDVESAPDVAPETAPVVSPEPSPAAAKAATPTRLAGRKRRAPRPKQGPTIVPGPVDPTEAPARDLVAQEKTDDAAPRPTTRSMGRFRRGSIGGSGSQAPGVDSAQPASSEPAGTAASGFTSGQTDLVEKMSRGYQGVGRRTAERLVEEFGDGVLDIIDNEPQRVEAVLPRGRAQAVIDGRRAEREANDG